MALIMLWILFCKCTTSLVGSSASDVALDLGSLDSVPTKPKGEKTLIISLTYLSLTYLLSKSKSI